MEDATARAGAPVGSTPPWRCTATWILTTVSTFSVIWFVALIAAPATTPALIGWILSPVCCLLCAWLCRRTGRDPSVPEAARYFWRRAGTAIAVFSVSMVSRLFDSLNPGYTTTARLSMTSAVLHGIGVALLVYPLFRLPLGTRTRAQRAALWLDVSTVMLATAVFLWHFSMRAVLTYAGDNPATVAAGIALMGSGLTGVLVVAKVAMTGSASLDRRALILLAVALGVGGLGSAFNGLMMPYPSIDTSLIVVPVAVLLIGLGARLERLGGRNRPSGTQRPPRRYSLLPYAAVAATDGLLIYSITDPQTTDRAVVATGAVLLTATVVIRQITAFRENEKLLTRLDAGLLELRRHEQRFRSLVQNSTDMVTVSQPDGRINYISPGSVRLLGVDPDDLIGTNAFDGVHPDDRDLLRAHVGEVLRTPGATATYQMRLRHADGSWRWVEVISANLMADAAVGGIVSNSRDVTEARQFQDRLSYEATHDDLTRLANRALFGERIRRSVAAHGPGHRVSLVLVDLDDFKTVNDTLGHAVGDALLVTVAQRMRDTVRPGDTVARLGGDEFAILLDDLSPGAVDEVVERITAALREPVQVDDHLLTVQASFGIVEGTPGDDAGDLLRQADIAMYEAKDRGTGGYQRYRPGMEARGAERARIAAELRTALDDDQFRLYYQPVVTLPTGTLTGVEALIRWQHPTRGLLGPGDFIPTAEQTGLIVPIGRWVLREACHQAARWRTDHGAAAPAGISVNVSARQLQDARFAADVTAALRDSGLDADRLTVEITESTAVGGGATAETLRQLRALGVKISLDDFGTGQSTLSLLADCPVDQIKLDRSFAPVPGQDVIATAVVQLARVLGVEAVAEGVETSAQAERLLSLGYEQAQGFHFARPMTAADITGTLSESPRPRATAA